jgi:hypothetical protein
MRSRSATFQAAQEWLMAELGVSHAPGPGFLEPVAKTGAHP